MEIERRSNTHLRLIFDETVTLTAPFFDSANNWGGSPLIRFAQITIREAYPQLSPQEIDILLNALQRVYAERNRKDYNSE